MASQDPEDWELLLTQVLVQFSQLSTSMRRLRDEEQLFERHTQPRLDPGCRTPLLEECPQHHGHKGDPRVTLGTCGAIGERAQMILVWVRAPGRWERLPSTETRSHEG